MKKTTLAGWIAATAAMVATAPTSSVLGADLGYGGYRGYPPASAAPPYAVPMNWTGPYAGVNLGYRWGSSALTTDPSGFAGGLQGGYNYQSGQFVIGLETDIQLSNADDTFAAYKFSNPWFGTLRGRIGWAMNNILLYGTGGFAYGGLDLDAFGMSESKTLTGWALGGGIEVALAPQWSARAEYLYTDLGEKNYALAGVDAGLESSIIRFGLNYRF